MSNFKGAYTLDQNKQKVYRGKSDKVFEIPQNAKGYKDYIDALYESSKELSPYAVACGADTVAEKMISDIINSPDTIKATGKTYYISNSGDDNADGLSPETAWASIDKLRAETENLKAGDAVLFERGGEWRKTDEWKGVQKNYNWTQLAMFEAKKGVSYGAYGIGPKPILNGSERNYADPNLWIETDIPNVYVCTEEFWNTSVVLLDDTKEIGNYHEKVSLKEVYGLRGFEDLTDFNGDTNHYLDVDEHKLYMYSLKGNPGERFKSIEIAGRIKLIANANAALIENFHIKIAGYGITSGTSMNVKNCIFSYIGGCQGSPEKTQTVHCGNAIEIYGDCDGFYVESCWMYQMCDTGVSHQIWLSEGECHQKNIAFKGNVIEHYTWGIEFNCPPSKDGSERIAENYDHSYNVFRAGGESWISDWLGRDFSTPYNCFGTAKTVNGLCEKNIFRQNKHYIYKVRLEGDKAIKFKDNINIQFEDQKLGCFYDDNNEYPYDENVDDVISKHNECEGQVYIYLEKY
ncbi:MAG: hypothetical protein E7561_03750 [Ruminococcaceae bacterium]|nr:hypothetical protein [Oscillospiraceae bacterium]